VPSLSVVGDYQVLGRCNDIDGAQVHAACKTSDPKAQLVSLHHFPIVSRSGEQQLRQLADKTRELDDPILIAPREILRSQDGLFVVTDFVAGETIEQIVKSHRSAISKVLAVAIARDVARAVERLRKRTSGVMFGDVTSAQVLVSYETGQLKLIVVGAALVRGRSVAPSTINIGEVLLEMLGGKKSQAGPAAANVTADLDRIVTGAITSGSGIREVGEELHAYLETRTISQDRSADLKKLIQQHFSHKAVAMQSLIERWRSQGASPRAPSVPPRAASVPPRRAASVPPRAASVPPRRSSSVRAPVEERRPEAALAEPEIAILEPVELVHTEDISTNGLRSKHRIRWPRMRLAFFMLLLSLSCATAALVMMNGEGAQILSAWRSVLAEAKSWSK
jgi:hypothetical protein